MRIPSNVKRLLIITFIGFLIIGLIIYFTADKRTWDALKTVNKTFLLLGITFYLGEVFFDAMRLKILVRGTGYKLNFIEAVKLIFFQVFFDLITPFSFGGQPFQIYVLHKKKVPGGSATTAVITKLLLGALALVIVALWAMLFYNDIFKGIPIFQYLLKLTGFLLLLITLIFLLGLYFPKTSARVIGFIFFLLWKLKLSKHPDELKNKVLRHLVLARNSFNSYISHGFLDFLMAFIFSCAMVLCMIMMLVCFLWGFNISIDVLHGIALTGSLIFLITFMPTPGSSGLGEGIFYLLFKEYVPDYLIGVIILLWRFFYSYLSAFLGAIVTGQYGSELLSSQKITEK